MGNSYTGHLQSTRFEEVLHNSIEASLRSNTVVPRPVFTQLYLEAEQRPYSHDGELLLCLLWYYTFSSSHTRDEDEDEEDGSDSNTPPIPYQMRPPPDGSCTTDGFCQAGKDLRLSSMATESLEVAPGFLLVGAKSPSMPDHILVCAVDQRFLPDECGRNALLGFSGNCMGCGEKGFRYFTEFADHINLKLTTQPKKQKHLKYHLLRNAQGILVKGPPICWKGIGKIAQEFLVNKDTILHFMRMGILLYKRIASATLRWWNIDNYFLWVVSVLSTVKREMYTIVVPTTLSWASCSARLFVCVFLSVGHGTLPHLCGNLGDVLVSGLLQKCYLNSQNLPRVYEQYGTAPIQPISTEMLILLTVYYLVQLAPDQAPLMEDLEQIFMRSWRESHLTEIRQYQQTHAQIAPPLPCLAQPLTPSQLPWLAKLATSSCGEGVLVLDTAPSLAEALEETFHRLVDGRLSQTNYVVIICMNRSQEIESCVVVTGKHQTRALAESLLSPSDCVREIVHELLKYYVEWHEIRPIQLAVARKLLSHVCAIADSSTQNLDLGSFDKVEFLICVPPSEVTFHQISLPALVFPGLLRELGLDQDCLSVKEAEQYVVKLNQSAVGKINSLIQKSKMNPYTLFILVHDHAHWDISSGQCSGGDSSLGLVDSLLNCRQIRDASNILTLHVTSFPFTLQTQYTRISPYNEIHWPSGFNNDVDLYHEKTKYFGVSELLETTRSGSGLPLLRYDSSFESMAAALEERLPKLHSAVIRTHVLIQHYSLALMVTAGGQALQALQKHISVETLEMVQCLLNTSQRCPSRHGHMLLLRIPSPALAAFAHQRLCHVRNRLGLHKQFEVILGDPCSALTVGKHFLDQLRVWLKILDPDWAPLTYLELEALPCILILTGMDPLGESLPRSLKYCDLRVISCWSLQRTTLEQELGLAAYLLKTKQDGQHGPHARCDLSESDPEKLSSTDNEDEEVVVDGLTHLNTSLALTLSLWWSIVNNELPKLGNQASPAGTQLPQSDWTPLDPDKQPNQRRQSKSTSSGSSSTRASPLRQSCSWARNLSRPPVVLLPKAVYDLITTVDSSGLPKSTSFLPHSAVEWVSSFRPLLSKMMTCTEQSLYYRQWTVPKPHHMDSSNRAEGRPDNFHPRKLLLSGPPQVGKTGAYLQFLGILSRMLIRLMEVDIYDEEDINCNCEKDLVRYHQPIALWPNTDTVQGMPFDYIIHDPKYEDISTVYSPDFTPNSNGETIKIITYGLVEPYYSTRIKLSKYAAYNTYHHCEQCHQYMGFNPQYQVSPNSTLHAFTFSHLLLGEEIQLYFIIPKSKEHHFSFSQSGGQLESMRLPLTSDWNPDAIKSPIFTPTTGRHEHGLFNLYHAMEGAAHLHILVIKEYEMAVYKKYWPNHIMLVLPTIFNGAGIGAAHFLIKELSYHNLELERSRRVEHGSRPQDVWPFIILADDSCVMWNSVDVDPKSIISTAGTERNVSLKQVLQHMESSPNITQYGLCGMRKWSSRGGGAGQQKDPFSRGHLHDFLLLNVDLTQNVQYNQNRFTCDDVDFNLRAHSAGLLICRFNNFSVMKKQIAIGGYGTFIIKTKMTDVPTTIQPTQYICAPDSKHLFLATPAQLLLEKYLQHTSHRLFPLSAQNYSHPVLSVDCYLNLGPEVTVCFVSSRPHSINFSTTGLLFSGLLLYFCDSFVTPGFLKKFQFLKGATLCVICPNRSSLRQTVVRLELEEEWRFRLSDEFQTANAKEDQPLFFLTGKHI
uniref:Growth regulating estrogen receptor binding 1 n=1 Tax=Cyprinus carpio TaxID=7962 RepID=A0A8C2ENC0_CYPCA